MTSPSTQPSVVVVSGNPRPGSRTTSFAARLARAVAADLDLDPDASTAVIDLATIEAPSPGSSPGNSPGNSLGSSPGNGSAAGGPAARKQAAATVQASRVLVVASPTYKASYTGLLKTFLDELPSQALRGVVAVPLMTAGAPGHSLAADVHLRPVLLELGAWTPTAAVVALDADLADPEPLIGGWLLRNGPVLRALSALEVLAG
jgi:FMN reductase